MPDMQQVIVDALLTIVTAIAGYAAVQVRAWIEAHVPQKYLDSLVTIATTAVQAAEQTSLGRDVALDGAAKKRVALSIAQKYIDSTGLKVSADQLDAAIEAAVMAEFNKPVATEARLAAEATPTT
jgi:2-methylaconitate cis-trans-isomerase PrpF